MMMSRILVTRTACAWAIVMAMGSAFAAEPVPSPTPRWRQIKDSVYPQEIGKIFTDQAPLRAVAVFQGVPFFGGPTGLFTVEKVLLGTNAGNSHLVWANKLAPVDAMKIEIKRLVGTTHALWAITSDGLYRLTDLKTPDWKKVSSEPVNDICEHEGEVILAIGEALFRAVGDAIEPLKNGGAGMRIERIASHGRSIYCLGPRGRIEIYVGNHFDRRNPPMDWGHLPSPETRDMVSIGSRLAFATARGLGILRGMTMHQIDGDDGLCDEDATCLAPGANGDLWVGSPRGAMRWTGDQFHYFAADRWLPRGRVNAIAADERATYVVTDGGLGVIEYQPFTLAMKASFYEKHLEDWGQKRLGFTHKLERGEGGEWIREVSDNDCGWSAEYLAAMTFKFATTGDPAAREAALDTFKTLKWAEEITGIDGFPARSIWVNGEKGHKAQHGSGGLPAEWHPVGDGTFEWKGDTSSDETDAHFYAVSIFHDLAATEAEKKLAAEHLGSIAGHIHREGWVLRDYDGKPTRWARWDPEYLQRPYGYYARGLNGMEVISYMRTAGALTGDAQFEEAFKKLAALGYPREVLRQKLTFPPDYVTQFDDRLAFYAYYPLLKYEPDPDMRAQWRRSLERSWEIERIERNPWFNFVYGALTGNDCEAEQAVATLREWPLDMIDWSHFNSHRADLAMEPGHHDHVGQGRRVLSPRERGPGRWSDNPFEYDGGGGGGSVIDPSGWLHAYWMGRYYGFISPPQGEGDKSPMTEWSGYRTPQGAKPYDGPPRAPLKSERGE